MKKPNRNVLFAGLVLTLATLVSLKIGEIASVLKIFGHPVDRFNNMFQVIRHTLGVLHRGCASRNTRSRNFSGKNPGVSTETGTPSNSRA